MKSLLKYLHNQSEKRCERRVAEALMIEDLWRLAQRRVPPIVWEYFRGGADYETTLRANVRAFQEMFVNPNGAVKSDQLDMRTTVAGHQVAVPWYISPVGSLRVLWPMAEAIAARVAGEFGTVMAQATVTGTKMEEVRAASKGQCWYQLYLCGGRETALRAIARAKAAGFTGLILTIDTAVAGNRVNHARMKSTSVIGKFKGLKWEERWKLLLAKAKVAPQMLPHIPWLLTHWYDGGVQPFVNIVDEKGVPMPYMGIDAQLAASAVTWDDIEWIRKAWGDDPLIIKGVNNAGDVMRAANCGVHAVVWSNHGGREQDRALPTLYMLKYEMPKVRHLKLHHMVDGGIRNGTDILIALSYGVDAVGLGRVIAAGIGAGGYSGLTRAFEILKDQFARAMRLVGVKSIAEIRERGEDIRRDYRMGGDGHLPEFVF
jgi:isopentenyl diphosphate isomerase/L-lactate dehydrogenase-like FMN-dependent dehydrogenase